MKSHVRITDGVCSAIYTPRSIIGDSKRIAIVIEVGHICTRGKGRRLWPGQLGFVFAADVVGAVPHQIGWSASVFAVEEQTGR